MAAAISDSLTDTRSSITCWQIGKVTESGLNGTRGAIGQRLVLLDGDDSSRLQRAQQAR